MFQSSKRFQRNEILKKEKVEELSVFCLLDCPLTLLFETQFDLKKRQYEKYVVPHVQVELA